jgi:hypothetical protein
MSIEKFIKTNFFYSTRIFPLESVLIFPLYVGMAAMSGVDGVVWQPEIFPYMGRLLKIFIISNEPHKTKSTFGS